jgi:hypothetical protein
MVVLTGSVRRHGRHDFGRHVFHAVEDNLRRCVQRSFNGRIWRNWLGELLNPLLMGKPSAAAFACSAVACSSDSLRVKVMAAALFSG